MEIHFTGKHIEVTEGLKTFATEKLQTLAKRNSHITNVNVVFHIERGMHKVEANVHFNGIEIHASAEEPDMYASIDALVDKLEAQIIRHKEKLIDNHR